MNLLEIFNSLPTDSKIQKIINKLKPILRIQDWDIEFEYCGDSEMVKLQGVSGELGYANINRTRKTAIIKINKDDPDNQTEWYETLVHELMHVVTNEVLEIIYGLLDSVNATVRERKDISDRFEYLVENLTKILVMLHGVDDMGKNEKEKQIEKRKEEFSEYKRDDSKKNKRNKKKK